MQRARLGGKHLASPAGRTLVLLALQSQRRKFGANPSRVAPKPWRDPRVTLQQQPVTSLGQRQEEARAALDGLSVYSAVPVSTEQWRNHL